MRSRSPTESRSSLYALFATSTILASAGRPSIVTPSEPGRRRTQPQRAQRARTRRGAGGAPRADGRVRIEAERDVVQEEPPVDAADVDRPFAALERRECGKRIVAIEADVAREVVPRPERHDDERQAPLDRDRCDCGRASRRLPPFRAAPRAPPRASSPGSSSGASTCGIDSQPFGFGAELFGAVHGVPERGLITRKPLMPLASCTTFTLAMPVPPHDKEPRWS